MDEAVPRLLDGPPPTGEIQEWLAKVDKIAPIVEKYRNDNEDRRVTSAETLDAVREAGLHRMWVSRKFGGGQVDIATGSAVIQALARLDASVAWQVGVQGAIGRLSDYLPEATSRKLFAESDKLVVGGVNPSGTAEAVEGGFRLSGKWSFASGSAHADWLVCAARVTDDGKPRLGEAGPVIRMLFLPRTSVTFVDDWHTLGLRGTGSVSYLVDDVFVGEDHTVDGAAMHAAPLPRDSRAYAISYYDFGPFTSSSTALGIAQDALRTFKEIALRKTPTGASGTLAGSHVVQDKLARMEMAVHSSRLVLAHAARQATEHGADGGDELTSLIRLTVATVAENACQVVDTAHQYAGTSSLYTTSRLERSLRDVRSAVKHITLSHSHFEMVGQYLLTGKLLMRR
ncbi:acyl-CoA dehydrogenase family protein [Amycolatopsis thailandensis]|uniref:acyl-CoA dehydrogenase family protein n=1 Tax=Amycolatopsis thailandensis TaxID=589330 RepID=UPI00364EC483